MRLRINRFTSARRNLIFGNTIKSSLVQPHFVVSGENVDLQISGMPGINRQSVDVLIKTIGKDMKIGLRSHMLFLVMDDYHRDSNASHASDPNTPLHTAVRLLKEEYGDEIVIMTDVCLCTGTDHGHCGVLVDNKIENDQSVNELIRIAISHAEAGVDYVAASDMMDGRVKAMREKFEELGFHSTGILSYSVKYASSFYGPFREAAESSPKFGDRRSHQMDFRSGYDEAIMEAKIDQEEGADILMIKPGLPYLDVIRKVSDEVTRPLAVYNVSGEYAMVMISNPNPDERGKMITEILQSFTRAGADVIVTYHAREAIQKELIE